MEDLKRRISEALYSPADNAFYDARAGSTEHLKKASSGMLAPLWAGVELPGNKARDMIWDKAIRPAETACGLPSDVVLISLDEGDAISPFAVRNLIHGLRNTGYNQNAKRIGGQLLSMISASPGLDEAFDAASCRGVGDECAVTAAVVIDAVRLGAGRP